MRKSVPVGLAVMYTAADPRGVEPCPRGKAGITRYEGEDGGKQQYRDNQNYEDRHAKRGVGAALHDLNRLGGSFRQHVLNRGRGDNLNVFYRRGSRCPSRGRLGRVGRLNRNRH